MSSDNLKQLITKSLFNFLPTISYELNGYPLHDRIRYGILYLLKDIGATGFSFNIDNSFISYRSRLELEFLNSASNTKLEIILSFDIFSSPYKSVCDRTPQAHPTRDK